MSAILIVDDHTLFTTVLASHLSKPPRTYKVLQAHNGKEAIDVLAENPVDVMLLDIQMPVMNGIETINHLKALPCKPKIIVLTMLDEHALIIHLFKNGVSAFVNKDSDIDVLEHAIAQVLQHGEFYTDPIRDILRHHQNFPCEAGMLELSPREWQVLNRINEGRTTKEIAVLLRLEVYTIESYRKSLMIKTRTRNTADLIQFAWKAGLLN